MTTKKDVTRSALSYVLSCIRSVDVYDMESTLWDIMNIWEYLDEHDSGFKNGNAKKSLSFEPVALQPLGAVRSLFEAMGNVLKDV